MVESDAVQLEHSPDTHPRPLIVLVAPGLDWAQTIVELRSLALSLEAFDS